MLLVGSSTAWPDGNGRILDMRRTFFGIHRVVRDGDSRFTDLYQGTTATTLHDRQSLAAPDEPLTYYHRTGPAGDVMRLLPHRNAAVVGLGAGALAAYADCGDDVTFLEIDRGICALASDPNRFTFLSAARDRGAKVNLILGEARLTLADLPDHSLDMLVLDAFSGGGAIPTHLLTREAGQLYLRKLKADGVIAMHVSNAYLDLRPVVAALAADRRCACLMRCDAEVTPTEMAGGKLPSQWVVLSPSRAALQPLERTSRWRAVPSHFRAWTDDYCDVPGAMRWGR
jgi:spermidine synthase